MNIALTRLRHIVAVAQTCSFSRAAADLHITQPALSRSIAGFEQQFDLRLFDRDRSGVAPTAMGKLVIAEAERVLRAARDLEHNLRLYAYGEGGDLAIGMGPLLAMLLPAMGKRLLLNTPGVHMQTSIRTPDHLVQELLEDRIELIFGNSWRIREIADLEITPIGVLPLAFMVRVGHPLAGRERVLMRQLGHYPQASAAGSSVGILQPGVGTFTCENYHVLRELVLETDCVWLASPAALDADLVNGRLVALAVSDFDTARSEVAVIRRRGRTLSPAAQAVTEQLREMLAPLDKSINTRPTNERRVSVNDF